MLQRLGSGFARTIAAGGIEANGRFEREGRANGAESFQPRASEALPWAGMWSGRRLNACFIVRDDALRVDTMRHTFSVRFVVP